jgi:hypothetical protein
MTRRIVGLLVFVVVAVGVAAGVYFTGQAGDGTTAAQERAGKPALTPDSVIQQWLAEGTVPPALTITRYPTCPLEPPTPIPGEQGTSRLATPAPWPCIPADQTPPDKAPDLSSLMEPREAEECEGCIDLAKPIPYELPTKVAGKTIYLPAGSTSYIVFADYHPAGVQGPTHVEVIQRGDSKVVIDQQTGKIIEWNIAPEDEADFRRLILEPLQSTP